MKYDLEQVARVCYAALRQLREEQGLPPGPPWPLLSAAEAGWYLRAVERSGLGCPPSRAHEEWRREMEADGWSRGQRIDHDVKTHPDLSEWRLLGEPARRRALLLQMITTGMCLEVGSPLPGMCPVTAL